MKEKIDQHGGWKGHSDSFSDITTERRNEEYVPNCDLLTTCALRRSFAKHKDSVRKQTFISQILKL